MKFEQSIVLLILVCFVYCFATVADIERQALLDLFEATNGPNWAKNENWGAGDPCENRWKFLVCDPANSTLVRLSSFRNGLVGTLPETVGNLANITYINLGTNNLYGTIPDSIWNLKLLEYFDFRMTNLTGTIPDSIGNWINVTEIEFFSTKFYGTIPSAITNLVNLQILALDQNNFSGAIPEGFEKLTQLERLFLNDNALTGTIPAELADLSHLNTLQLQDNFLTGTIPFQQTSWFYINLDMSCNCFDSFPDWCYNSSCKPCVEGICNVTTAVISTPKIFGHSVGINSALGAIGGICLIVAITSLLLLFIKSDMFGVHGHFYSALVHIGVIIGIISALFALPEPTDGYCVAFPWLFGIAFALVYGCLFIKTWALWEIWQLAQQFKRSDMTPRDIIFRIGICVLFEVIFLVVWTVVDPPVARTFKSSGGSLRIHCTNVKYDYAFWIAFIVYKGVWMVFGLILTLLTKPIQKGQSEPKEIALAIYNVFAVSIIAIPLAFALKDIPQGLVIVQVAAVLLAFIFTLLAIFFSAWYRIFGPDPRDFPLKPVASSPSISSSMG